MSIVVLAEKPKQAQAYASSFKSSKREDGYYIVNDPLFKGEECYITYAIGHLIGLVSPEKYGEKWAKWSLESLPIMPEKFEFEVTGDKKAQFKIVSKLVNEADTIIIATDCDREGENIAWSILKQAKIDESNKTIKRLWINSLESDVIYNGFKSLKDYKETYNYYIEAQTRQKADWLVGMNASPLYTLNLQKHGVKGAFSVGRVQTPTLYMIYNRQQKIENFKEQTYFEILGYFEKDSQMFTGNLVPTQKFTTQEESKAFIESNVGSNEKFEGHIKAIETKEKKQYSPKLFSLSLLQSEINKRFKASANDTLKAMQTLYEGKWLTYPRTDCNFITTSEHEYLVKNLDSYISFLGHSIEPKDRVLEPNKRYVDNAKVQEHYAIVPTKKVINQSDFDGLKPLEQNIYKIVLERTIAMFLEPYTYDETNIFITVGQLEFKAIGKTEKNKGWKKLFDDGEKKEQEENKFPVLKENDVVSALTKSIEKKTTPPKPFTEGTLITAMKNVNKELDEDETEDIEVLKEVEGIGTEATRANIIETLKSKEYIKVEKNNLVVTAKGVTLCSAVSFENLLKTPSMTAKWETMLKRVGKGEVSQDKFLMNIKKFIAHLIESVPQAFESPEMAAMMGIVEKQEEQEKQAAAIGKCPICQKLVVDKGSFYGCEGYNSEAKCMFSLPKKYSKKTLTKTSLKQLLEKGITGEIKGFESQKGKKFDAKLKLTEEYKLKFEFEQKTK